MSPILSICIPTYNRHNSLRILLNSIVENLENVETKRDIEIVILNNNSTDDTEKVVDYFKNELNIIYHKNSINIGIAPNIKKVTDFATGKFAWIVGDDDLIGKNALSQILCILNKHPKYTGYVLPLYQAYAEHKEKFFQFNDINDTFFRGTISLSKDKSDFVWEELLLRSKDYHLFTSIPSMIFNREIYISIQNKVLKNFKNDSFTTVENTFPHLVVWSNMFLGKTVYLCSNVKIYFFIGEQEWIGQNNINWLRLLYQFYVPFLENIKLKSHYFRELESYKNRILLNKSDLIVFIQQRSFIFYFRHIVFKNLFYFKFYMKLMKNHLNNKFNLFKSW